MAGISKEERERRKRIAEAGESASRDAAAMIDSYHIAAAEAAEKSGQLESRHWPGLFYDASDPEPEQNNMLGTKDPVWRAWFERNGGQLK